MVVYNCVFLFSILFEILVFKMKEPSFTVNENIMNLVSREHRGAALIG